MVVGVVSDRVITMRRAKGSRASILTRKVGYITTDLDTTIRAVDGL